MKLNNVSLTMRIVIIVIKINQMRYLPKILIIAFTLFEFILYSQDTKDNYLNIKALDSLQKLTDYQLEDTIQIHYKKGKSSYSEKFLLKGNLFDSLEIYFKLDVGDWTNDELQEFSTLDWCLIRKDKYLLFIDGDPRSGNATIVLYDTAFENILLKIFYYRGYFTGYSLFTYLDNQEDVIENLFFLQHPPFSFRNLDANISELEKINFGNIFDIHINDIETYGGYTRTHIKWSLHQSNLR